ncbi:MAG: hypothetical protein KDD11_11230 [Acidobacteria bacterium]|nr:hypothetical protein [Acidobacteriota bacterium]
MPHSRVSISQLALGVAAGCALLLAPAVLRAEQPADGAGPGAEQTAQVVAQAPAAAPTAQTTQPANVQGLKAFVDEEGRLRPPTEAEQLQVTRGELAALGAAVRQQAPVKSADGTLSLVLDTSYLQSAVAHVGEDGKIVWDCVEHTADAPVQSVAREEK